MMVLLIPLTLINYLLFHTVVEIFAITVNMMICLLSIRSYRHSGNNLMFCLGVCLPFVIILDLLHMLCYQGMNILPTDGSNTATQLWIAGRYLQALALVLAPCLGERKTPRWLPFVFAAVTLGVILTVWVWPVFPVCYRAEAGLTYFKVISELIICMLFLLSLKLFFTRKKLIGKPLLQMIKYGIILTVSSELFFMVYINAFDIFNWLGHILRLVASYVLYRGIVLEELDEPYNALEQAYNETLDSLALAIEFRDHETRGHSQRVADLTLKIARECHYGKEALLHIYRGALLHDIGKIGVPDNVLLKPGPLSDEEWVIMKKHPEIGAAIMSQINYLIPAIDIPLCHHEKWDGSGYPRGLKGEEIPLTARIFTVVDVWDALTSDRPYRPAWSRDKVIEYIKARAGSEFDPAVVDVFMTMVLC
jgi:putative nucleotidyltransferase with HDIG domain